MIRVSAFPTVEWLHSRAADRPPISPSRRRSTGISDPARDLISGPAGSVRSFSARHPARGRGRRSDRTLRAVASVRHVFLESLAVRIAGALAPCAGVYVDQWVSTPDGEQLVDVVVRCGERSVGLVVGHRYEQDTETVDALRLVYGGFDVLLRLNRVDSSRSVDDALHALVCEKPSWFTAAGRVGAARRASAAADAPGRVAIRRMRLSRANEWVAAFERALGSPARAAGHPERD